MSLSSKNNFIILIICCFIYILSGFHRLSPNILSSYLVSDFSLTASQLGLMSSATMLSYGLMQLPSGILTDSIGGKRTLILFLLISCVGVIWFGVTNSFSSTIIPRLLVGIGAAITVPCMVVLANTFPAHVFGRINSIFTCTGGLGGFIAASPLAFSCEIFGWRLSVIFSGILTLMLALTVWLVFKNKNTPTEQEKFSFCKTFVNIKLVLTNRSFWPLTLWLATVVSLFFLFVGLWWGPYLIQANNINPITASYIISFGSIVWILGQPLIGFISDKIKKRRILLIICTFLALLSSLSMLFFTGSLSIPLLILQAGLFIMGTNAATLIFTMLKESFPPYLLGTAIGCANCLYPIFTAIYQNVYGMLLDWRLAVQNGDQVIAFSEASWVYIISCIIGLSMAFLSKESYLSQNKS